MSFRTRVVNRQKRINKLKLLFVFAVFCFSLISGQVSAMSTKDIEAIRRGSTYYKPEAAEADTCTYDQIDSSSDTNAKGKKDMYKSGLNPNGPFVLETFMVHVLKALAQKTGKPESDFLTKQHVVALTAFAMGEGGDINNQSVFNPMNLGLSAPDLPTKKWGAGTDGTQSYASFDIGIEAYARQFLATNQSRLGFILGKKDSTADEFMFALTHYEKYKDNKFWAKASLPKPQGIGVNVYLEREIGYIRDVKNNYQKTAGLVIGTPEKEQANGTYKPSLLQFKNIGDNSVDDYTATVSNANNETCNSNDNSSAPGTNGWDLKGSNALTVYEQNDPKWANKSYFCGPIGNCGCWVVTTAIIVSTLTDHKLNPAQLLDKYGQTFYPTTPAIKEGLSVDNIGTNLNDAAKAIKNGGLVAAYFHTGTFTSKEHMMIIRKVSDDGKKFYVYDLRGINDSNNTKSYTKEDLLNKANLINMYAITKKGSTIDI